MGFSDDQIHDILELKEQLTEEIEKHLEEIEKLEKNISVLNTILKQTSFTKASDLTHQYRKKERYSSNYKKFRWINYCKCICFRRPTFNCFR